MSAPLNRRRVHEGVDPPVLGHHGVDEPNAVGHDGHVAGDRRHRVALGAELVRDCGAAVRAPPDPDDQGALPGQ